LSLPQDAKAIAQLASVAQGIVQTSVKLEQIRAEKKGQNEETIRYLLSKIPQITQEADALQVDIGTGLRQSEREAAKFARKFMR
jgi:hypothetical protein